MDKQTLRTLIRKKRRDLSFHQQYAASRNLFFRIARHRRFKQARSIGLYLSTDGEISLAPLIKLALKQDKACFLPAIDAKNIMTFRHYTHAGELTNNRYGIPQPLESAQHIACTDLDLVLLPLVAFDARGNRLGMGGGYYDRAFAFISKQKHHSPYLVGVAHSCQQVDALMVDSWDIPLNAMATDSRLMSCKAKKIIQSNKINTLGSSFAMPCVDPDRPW